MRKVLKIFLWTVVSIISLLFIITIFINSHWGINTIKDIVLRRANQIPNISANLSDIQMNIFGNITIKNVTLSSKYQGISAKSITVRFSLISLIKKDVKSIVIVEPMIRIKGKKKNKGNMEKKVLLPNITIRKIYIKNGAIEYQDYNVKNIKLSGSILKEKNGLNLKIDNLEMKYKSIPVKTTIAAVIDSVLNIHIKQMALSFKKSFIVVSGDFSAEEVNSRIKGRVNMEDFSSLLGKKKVKGVVNFHYFVSGNVKNPELTGDIKIGNFRYDKLRMKMLHIASRIKDKKVNLTIRAFERDAITGNIYADFDGNVRGMLTLNKFDVSSVEKDITSSINGNVQFSLSKDGSGNFNVLFSHSSFQKLPISYVCIKVGMKKHNTFKIDTLLVEGKGIGISIEGDISKKLTNLTISTDSLNLESFSGILNMPLKGQIHSDIAVIGDIRTPTVVGNLWGRGISFKNIGIPYFEMGISASNIVKSPKGVIDLSMKNISIGKIKLNDFRLKVNGIKDTLNYNIQGGYSDKKILISGISQIKNGMKVRIDTFSISDSLKGNVTNPKPAFISISKGKIQIDKFILNGPGSNVNIWGTYSTRKLDLVMDVTASDLRRVAGYVLLKKILKGNGEIILNVSGTQDKPQIGILGWMNAFVFEDARYDSIRVQMDYKNNIFNIARFNMYYEDKTSGISGFIPVSLSLSRKKHIILSEKTMDVRINIEDLGLWPFARSKSVMDIYRGNISLQVQAKGIVKNPVIRGNVGIDSMGVYLTSLGTKITNIKGNVKFDNRKVVIGPLNGRTGTGKFFTSGKIKMKKFKPQTMDIKTTITRLSIKGIENVDALLDVDVVVKGKVKSPVVTGSVKISKAIISIPFKKKEGGSVASVKSPAKLHLKIIMPGNVWIRNDFADMELSGSITIERDRNIKIDGKANVVDGYFYYFDKPFKVEKGEFRFQGGGEMNPSIDLVAKTEVRMQKENEEEISGPVVLIVGGTMLSPTFDLHTESPLPPLELKDIIPLLNIDMTWKQIASFQKMSSALPSKAITYLIRTQLLNRIQSTVGIDALDLQANLFGKEKSTKITVGKYITKNIYASYSKDILAQSPDQFKVQYFIKKYGSFTTERDEQGRYWSGIEIKLKF